MGVPPGLSGGIGARSMLPDFGVREMEALRELSAVLYADVIGGGGTWGAGAEGRRESSRADVGEGTVGPTGIGATDDRRSSLISE